MRFKDYLREAKHRSDVTLEQAMILFQKYCTHMDFEKPCWRGSRKATGEAFVVQGDMGGRSSANSDSNHYTICMDEFLPKLGYPKRSASIILANYNAIVKAESYSKNGAGLYAIFPYDGVPIGVCEEEDIWDLKIKVGLARRFRDLEDWNRFFADAGIPDYSYEDMINGIKETLDDPEDESYNMVRDIFGNSDDVEDYLKDAYGNPSELGVKLITSEDLDTLSGNHELWIGGRCVAIHYKTWKKLTGKKHEHDDGEDE